MTGSADAKRSSCVDRCAESLASQLARTAVFETLPPQLLLQVAASGQERRFARGSTVLYRMARPSRVYVLCEGEAEVVSINSLGNCTVFTMGPGEVLGELATPVRRPSWTTITAKSDIVTVELDVPALAALLGPGSTTLGHVKRAMSERMQGRAQLATA